MVAGVAYSSFAFKPLWHPPLVRNASFAIQDTIPMEYMKTLKFMLFLFTRQKPWKTDCGTKGKTHCGIGVDPRRVQGEVPKRSGVQSHCRSLRCSVLQLSHNSFIAVLVCSCPLFQSCLASALPL